MRPCKMLSGQQITVSALNLAETERPKKDLGGGGCTNNADKNLYSHSNPTLTHEASDKTEMDP